MAACLGGPAWPVSGTNLPRPAVPCCALLCSCRLFRNLEEVEKLSELGVLFLLFEMGLELSIDRLRVCGWGMGVGVQTAGQLQLTQREWNMSGGAAAVTLHKGAPLALHGIAPMCPPSHLAVLAPAATPRRKPPSLLPVPPQALARFAFGMGTLQMLICTLAFAGLGLPPGGSWFSAVRTPCRPGRPRQPDLAPAGRGITIPWVPDATTKGRKLLCPAAAWRVSAPSVTQRTSSLGQRQAASNWLPSTPFLWPLLPVVPGERTACPRLPCQPAHRG